MTVALKNWKRYIVTPGDRVHLQRIPAENAEFCADKQSARKELKRYRKQIDELLAVLAAEQKRSLLIILQGVDASGKDGAVRKVFRGVNPQHCKVTSFKEPDREELAHDYMWRIYRAMPAKGELAVFNRSHYEDVLVLQARGKLSRKDAHLRLRQIADMERTWAENETVIRKFFLHISRAEQTRRFKSRLETPHKNWKIEESDFKDRGLWPDFMAVYEESLSRTSTACAPWYVIPADRKWYRDLAVAGIVLATLREMRPHLPMPRLNRHRLKL